MPPTALVESGEDAHYAVRADTLGSVTRQLAVRRVPADRFPKGVLAQGESPTPRSSQQPALQNAPARWPDAGSNLQHIVRRGIGCSPIRLFGSACAKTAWPYARRSSRPLCLAGWLGQPWAPRSPLRRGTRRARAHLPLIRPGDTLIAHSGCFQPLHAENHCFLPLSLVRSRGNNKTSGRARGGRSGGPGVVDPR